jgi:hypothetical protein
MTIPTPFAARLQSWLHVFSYDCYFADALTSGLCDGDERARWQTAIDTLYRFVRSGLLYSPHVAGENWETASSEYMDYFGVLARSDPFTSDLQEGIQWCMIDFCSTDSLRELLGRHRIREHPEEPCDAFIQELEQLFEVSGVAWSESPLIPICASQ